MRRLFSILPVVMLAALLVACGSASTNASGSTASTPTTSCLTVSTGTVQSVSGNSLLVTNLQGKAVQVTFTSATTFMRQSTVTPSSLKIGTLVSITVNSTYSALTVSIRNSLTRRGGFTGSSRLCSAQFPRGTRTPGTPGTSSGGQGRQTINGTVSQIKGNVLTVTDTSSNVFTVTLTATTRITAQLTASASDLQSGKAVMITGTANSHGVISASSISILQAFPNRRPTATPTPTP